eukprot:909517-Prorocentrum_minimum.AAC.1
MTTTATATDFDSRGAEKCDDPPPDLSPTPTLHCLVRDTATLRARHGHMDDVRKELVGESNPLESDEMAK